MKSFKYTTLECGEWFEALWQKVCQHCHWGCLTHPFFSFNTQIHSNSNNFVKTCTYSMLNLANHTEKLISWINSWKIYPTQIFTCASSWQILYLPSRNIKFFCPAMCMARCPHNVNHLEHILCFCRQMNSTAYLWGLTVGFTRT